MDIDRFASVYGQDVVNELRRAESLAQHNFHTEAAIRIGRAIEAALYETARELSIDLTNRVIVELDRIQDELRARQVELLRKQTPDAVRELSNISKNLSECIARLTEDPDLRGGRLDQRPRPNEQLLRELIAKTDSEPLRIKLGASFATLRVLQESRNKAAHASVEGNFSEFRSDEYDEMRSDAVEFIEQLLDLLLGVRSERFWDKAAEAGSGTRNR